MGGNRTSPRRHEPLCFSSEKWPIPLGDFDVPPCAYPEASDLGPQCFNPLPNRKMWTCNHFS